MARGRGPAAALPHLPLESEVQIGPNGLLDPLEFDQVKPPTLVAQPWLVARMQVGRVDITDVITGKACITIQPYVGTGRPLSSGDQGNRHRAQPRGQGLVG